MWPFSDATQSHIKVSAYISILQAMTILKLPLQLSKIHLCSACKLGNDGIPCLLCIGKSFMSLKMMSGTDDSISTFTIFFSALQRLCVNGLFIVPFVNTLLGDHCQGKMVI